MGMYKRFLSYASENAKSGELRRKTDWQKTNKAKCADMKRDWRRRNPGYRTEEARRYREKHRGQYNAKAARYRSRKKLASTGDVTFIYNRASELRSKGFDVEVDHVLPLSRGGTHDSANLQIISKHENRMKYNNTEYKPKEVFV